MDAETPVECGEKHGEFLPGKPRTIVRAFQDEKTKGRDSQAARGAARKDLPAVRQEWLLHQRVQAGQVESNR